MLVSSPRTISRGECSRGRKAAGSRLAISVCPFTASPDKSLEQSALYSNAATVSCQHCQGRTGAKIRIIFLQRWGLQMLTGLHKASTQRTESLTQSAGDSLPMMERHVLRTQLLTGQKENFLMRVGALADSLSSPQPQCSALPLCSLHSKSWSECFRDHVRFVCVINLSGR